MFRNFFRSLAGNSLGKVAPILGAAAFVDSNIILEGRPLTELPWREIAPEGPVYIYLVPQVLVEVDRKKHDGRLQVHARRFNQLVGPLATRAKEEIVLVDAPIRVLLRLAEPKRINWDKLDGWDRQDGDSRIVAEVLHSATPVGLRRVVVSHDLGPLSKASRYGLETLHVDHSWLRVPEPTKAETEIARLSSEVQRLKKEQPDLKVDLQCLVPVPVAIHRVAPIDFASRAHLTSVLMKGVRQTSGRGQMFELPEPRISQQQVEQYRDDAVPAYLDQLPQQLELMFGQVQLALKIEGVGNVHATGLIVRISASGGWLNRGVAIANISGPPKPKPYDPLNAALRNLWTPPPPPPGKQELAWAVKPSKSSVAELQCEDFRAGRSDEIKFVLWIDPRAEKGAVVHIELSARNMKGVTTTHLAVPKTVTDSTWDDLVDVSGKGKFPYPTAAVIQDAIERQSYADLDFRSD